jgi:hypothetical protein
MRKLKELPKLASEEEEAGFWATHDSPSTWTTQRPEKWCSPG